jgi:hypothetical protein
MAVGDKYLELDTATVYTLVSTAQHWDAGVTLSTTPAATGPSLPSLPLTAPDDYDGYQFLNTTDNKVYTVISTTWDTGTVLNVSNTVPCAVGDRYLVNTPTDVKIYTVTSTAPYSTPPTGTNPVTGQQYVNSFALAFDSGVTPDVKWAVTDMNVGAYIVDPVTNITQPRVLQFYGSNWNTTSDPHNGLGWEEVCYNSTTHTYEKAQYGQAANAIRFIGVTVDAPVTISVNEHVYFQRISSSDEWIPVESTTENLLSYVEDYIAYNYTTTGATTTDRVIMTTLAQQYTFNRRWKRHIGRDKLNFSWFHFSPRYHLVDPSPTNIIDIFVITRGYFISFKRWLEDPLSPPPTPVTPLSLRNDYGKLLENKMASDTVVLHPGKIQLLFGDKAAPQLRAKMKVVRSANSTLTDNQIKNSIVATTRNFFDIAAFEFGETFFFTELAAAIHLDLSTEISSVVLVPTVQNSQFGDLMQIFAKEDEILYPDIGVEDIDIVTGFNATNLKING